MEERTQEEILQDITAARDSVFMINSEIAKLEEGVTGSAEARSIIDANVEHLKIIVALEDVVNYGEDISDLNGAIEVGEAALAEYTWEEETE